MQRRFTTVDGISLAYIEKNPQAHKTIFFIHGNSGSSRTWNKQLESPLFSSFRLVAFDLPAHGFSSPSSNPDNDYAPITLGKIMAEAVSSLSGDGSYILIGFSFGTNIIGEMLLHDLKPAGIILVSSCVISSVSDLQKVFLPNPIAGMFFNDFISSDDLNTLALDCFFLRNSAEQDIFKSDFENTKTPFRSTLMKKAGEGAVSNEIELLKKMGLSILIIFGSEDKIVNVDYLDTVQLKTWETEIYKLPMAGHFVHLDRSELCNRLISDYAGEIFTTSHV